MSRNDCEIPVITDAGNKALLFMMYTTLYSNDMVYNYVKELESFIVDKDKETKKIYGALRKRIDSYFDKTNKLLGSSSYFFADFASFLDEDVDKAISELKSIMLKCYNDAGFEDSDFLSILEVTRSICAIAVDNVNDIQMQLVKQRIIPQRIEYGNLTEIFKILNNLCNWAYRKVDKNILVSLDSDVLRKKINVVIDNIFDLHSFNDAYLYAMNLERERNVNGS